MLYWSTRATSRLRMSASGEQFLCLVVDAIDHTKFRYPRTRVAASKDFAEFIRPTMDMTAAIMHGHHMLLGISEGWVKNDSSWIAELIAHSLSLVT